MTYVITALAGGALLDRETVPDTDRRSITTAIGVAERLAETYPFATTTVVDSLTGETVKMIPPAVE